MAVPLSVSLARKLERGGYELATDEDGSWRVIRVASGLVAARGTVEELDDWWRSRVLNKSMLSATPSPWYGVYHQQAPIHFGAKRAACGRVSKRGNRLPRVLDPERVTCQHCRTTDAWKIAAGVALPERPEPAVHLRLPSGSLACMIAESRILAVTKTCEYTTCNGCRRTDAFQRAMLRLGRAA